MNISAPFIRRPIGTALLTTAIILAGAVAYLQLPVAPVIETTLSKTGQEYTVTLQSAKLARPLERWLDLPTMKASAGSLAALSPVSPARHLKMRSIRGTTKAAVFPVPVWASPETSLPFKT